ncbi:hypothetical protein B296_00016171 [Ensete ventricosum]|uniref:Uncharacterized protein n=1 Tax=Ensete ventricosum TaxID=4639 RepID=A0A426YRU2_ENSVE|nr:hypothetical protein B296_00016171 [Ensete ventricosum]
MDGHAEEKSISLSTRFGLPAYPSFTEVAWGPRESSSCGSCRSSDHEAGHYCWRSDRSIGGVMEPPLRISICIETANSVARILTGGLSGPHLLRRVPGTIQTRNRLTQRVTRTNETSRRFPYLPA